MMIHKCDALKLVICLFIYKILFSFFVIHALGGESSNRKILSSVEVYNPVTNKTRKLSPLPTPRRSLGISIIEKVIYAIGGSDGTHALTTVEVKHS